MNSKRFFILTVCLCVLALATSLYVWELRKRAEATPPLPAVPQAATTRGVPKRVTLWIAHDDPGVLLPEDVSLDLSTDRQRQAEEILGALISAYNSKEASHHLPPDAEVRSVYFVDPGLAVIDVNSELTDGEASGILAEELLVASFVQTLSSNMDGIVRVKFLVDGKEATTLAGHADLSDFYDTSQVSALVQQLSAPR